jgi:hypothetical protein
LVGTSRNGRKSVCPHLLKSNLVSPEHKHKNPADIRDGRRQFLFYGEKMGLAASDREFLRLQGKFMWIFWFFANHNMSGWQEKTAQLMVFFRQKFLK